MTGFLGRVTRYVASGDREPREDRLTEITAAVLERVPGLGRELALGWLAPRSGADHESPSKETDGLHYALRALPSDTPVSTATQRTIPHRRVDLELRFRDPETNSQVAVIWVEAKHGTDPHSGQIPAYRLYCPQPGAVVLLTTRDRLPADPDECPRGVPQRSWHATAQRARQFARRVTLDDPVAAWLLQEWLLYLEEEGLVDPESLGPEHMTALTHYAAAEDALAPLCATAMVTVSASIGRDVNQLGEDAPRGGLNYWASWGMTDTDHEQPRWDGAWFDWKIVRSTGLAHGIPAGHVFVMAGLSKPKPGEFTSSAPDWYDDLRRGIASDSGPVVFHRWRGDCERLQRVAYLHQIVRGDTLEQQGRELGAWIIETFETLREHGPPHAASEVASGTAGPAPRRET